MKFRIKLMSAKDAEEFVRIASSYDYDIDLKSGIAYLDAKSLLGVISCGVKREMEVICQDADKSFFNRVKKFAIA
ncbi:MAG: Nif11-like leader peptide family natural product precursor [Lachnospiraceae bacterium]|nr:Nif11-like leader peptide family natural product precursor [Lachnospiraceae bacterium]